MPSDSLTLKGKKYTASELIKLADEKIQAGSGYEFHLFSFIKEWLSPDDTITVKTSGSTGAPKLVSFRKQQMVESAKMTCTYFNLTQDSNMLLCLSTEYIGGKMMVVRALVSGANLITVEPGSNPLETIKEKIHFAAMVPLQVQNTLQNEPTKKTFEAIDNVIIGGVAVSYLLAQNLAHCANNAYSTFAMTETLSHIALKKLSGKDKSDLYELLPGINIEKDERGCLVINAPLLNDKPVITNDVVEIEDRMHFRWLGRYDNVINSGGIKIYPEKVEEKLLGIITKHRFFITSLPDEKLGQKAVMVLENASDEEVAQIKLLVEQKADKYEKPRIYLSVQKFAETPTGKVQRTETLRLGNQG